MNSDTFIQVSQIEESNIKIGISQFCDNVWDLSPLITQKSLSSSRKLVKFDSIHSAQLRFTIKQYIYYKLGQVKPQTVIGCMNSLHYFIRYCKNNAIYSLQNITKKQLLLFSAWLKNECGVSKRTGYMAYYAVQELISVGQIKGWLVTQNNIFNGATATEIWGSGKDDNSNKKVKPIPDDVFDKIMSAVLTYKEYHSNDVITKCGIIIQSQTGLRINEVLSIKSGCLHEPKDMPPYFEVWISKTSKGEPILHQVFANELVVKAIKELECSTALLRKESGMSELFLTRNKGICVPKTTNWSKDRLRTFIRRCDIRDSNGELYHLTSHQFRATFVKQLIMKNIPISYVMKQFSHVSIEMTCHYLTLQENEVKDMYSKLILTPGAKIAGLGAEKIKSITESEFRGKTEKDYDDIISSLSNLITFNPLPGGVCLYDYRRGNCSNGNGCFFYNCPNFVTEKSFLPILKKELELMESEMERTEKLGYERQWQIQNSRYQCLKPLIEKLEGESNEQ